MTKFHIIAATFMGIMLAFPAFAQENDILSVIQSGELKFKTMIAVPEPKDPGNAAPALLGESSNSTLLTDITEAQEAAITDRAYPLLAAKWPFGVVYVCWEDFSQSTPSYRVLIRQAIEGTWEKHSGLEFPGWSECFPGDKGIRIAVEDSGPHVKFLGKYMNGVRNGMVLNATYQNWSPGCQNQLDYCNRTIAVHEFGHAIGFAHEQNRPDTPGDCMKTPQGGDGDTLLTPWDPNSVMNYCNEDYNNDGVLSKFDIVAAQYIYGRN